MSSNEEPGLIDDLADADETDETDPSWLPVDDTMPPLEADPADWIDQQRTVPVDPSDEAPRP